jgi:hypothetical protein
MWERLKHDKTHIMVYCCIIDSIFGFSFSFRVMMVKMHYLKSEINAWYFYFLSFHSTFNEPFLIRLCKFFSELFFFFGILFQK